MGSSNAWLALDRNGDGLINNAQELFGNVTYQTASSEPNGFLALSMFDLNGDGVIDKADPVWAKLLGIDVNHDGVSQPSELHHLSDTGVRSINLKYKESQYTDSFGNRFRYKGHLASAKDGTADRVIYDVFLTFK